MKRSLLQLLFVAATAVLLLTAALAWRALTLDSMQLAVAPRSMPKVNIERAVETLQEALRIPTISPMDDDAVDAEAFLTLHQLLETRFPLVHSHLKKETVSELSLIYAWEGADPAAAAMLMLAHQDVVAAPDPEAWLHPPFSGALADGYVWGRGALDDKSSLLGTLEAVETLLEQGFQPQRTIYLCFGHDEEVGGWRGAAAIAALLKSRGVRAAFSLDEGMAVVGGAILGLKQDIAFVALTEKGYLSLELTARGEAGHSSTPPRETALGILAKAVHRLETNPMPANLPEPLRLMFKYLAPEMPFAMRMVFANLWLTEPLVLRLLSRDRMTDAALRTTTAITILEGGEKDNVLPSWGRAVVNFRPKPGDTVAEVKARVKTIINDDRIDFKDLRQANESPPLARVDSSAFADLQETIAHAFPEAVVAPTMTMGGTDSHHYAEVADNIYRFSPLFLTQDDLESFHAANERISPENYERMIRFYIMMIEKAAG